MFSDYFIIYYIIFIHGDWQGARHFTEGRSSANRLKEIVPDFVFSANLATTYAAEIDFSNPNSTKPDSPNSNFSNANFTKTNSNNTNFTNSNCTNTNSTNINSDLRNNESKNIESATDNVQSGWSLLGVLLACIIVILGSTLSIIAVALIYRKIKSWDAARSLTSDCASDGTELEAIINYGSSAARSLTSDCASDRTDLEARISYGSSAASSARRVSVTARSLGSIMHSQRDSYLP